MAIYSFNISMHLSLFIVNMPNVSALFLILKWADNEIIRTVKKSCIMILVSEEQFRHACNIHATLKRPSTNTKSYDAFLEMLRMNIGAIVFGNCYL